MKALVICKSCGFILEQEKLREVCPACGVPAKMFEAYQEKISPKRKFLLSLDLHPVMVHFPQAFSFTLLLLSLLAFFGKGPYQAKLAPAIGVLALLLPIMTFLSILAGLVDGKVRFRKINTPLLIQKMVLGSIFLVLSLVGALLTALQPDPAPTVLLVLAVIYLAALGFGTKLAFIGISLLNAKFPG